MHVQRLMKQMRNNLKYITSTSLVHFVFLGIKATEAPAHQSYNTEDLTILTKKLDRLIEVNITQREGSNNPSDKEKG